MAIDRWAAQKSHVPGPAQEEPGETDRAAEERGGKGRQKARWATSFN